MFLPHSIAQLATYVLAIDFPLTLAAENAEKPKPAKAGTAIYFPKTPFVIDVTKPPYGANGDVKTDDTDALQRAISENTGHHRLIYFPKGTYLISATLKWPNTWRGRDDWGMTYLCGEDPEKSILHLRKATSTDTKESAARM